MTYKHIIQHKVYLSDSAMWALIGSQPRRNRKYFKRDNPKRKVTIPHTCYPPCEIQLHFTIKGWIFSLLQMWPTLKPINNQ